MTDSESMKLSPEVQNTIDQHNDAVAEQNDAYEQSVELSPYSIQSIVQTDIAERQLDDFHELLVIGASGSYEELATKSLTLAAEAQQLKHQISDKQQAIDQEAANIQAAIDKAIALAPRRKSEIETAGATEVQNIKTSLPTAELDSIERELNQVNDDIEAYGKPWNIPVALSAEDRLTMFEMLEQEQVDNEQNHSETASEMIIDIIPVTPEERMRQAELAEKAQREARIVENAEASSYVTYYLSEKVSSVVTVDEMARFLYINNVDQHRSHITTLLGPKVQGKRIQKMLQDEYGLVLQYGWRRLKRVEDGKQSEIRRTRIYRAIDPTSNEVLDDVIVRQSPDEKSITDEFSPLEVSPTLAVTIETQAVEIEIDQSIEQKEDWREKFIESIDTEIARLMDSSLFNDDEMRGTTIRSMSISNKLGTQTMRDRLTSARLMTRAQVKRDTMTREQRVVGLLFNAHKEIFDHKLKRKEAIELIHTRIMNHLPEDKEK